MEQNKIEAIKQIFPSSIVHTKVHDDGDDFYVIEVNGEWMFRFPRSPEAVLAMEREIAFLEQFRDNSNLRIPEYQYIDTHLGGYRKIDGVNLTPNLVRSLTQDVQGEIARQMGQFLKLIHSFPVEEARRIGLQESWGRWRQKIYDIFQKHVLPSLSDKTRRNVMQFFDKFFAIHCEPVVVHGDFNSDHILFSRQKDCVEGVIDFGDLSIEDSAIDFYEIFGEYGEQFFHKVVRNYYDDDPLLYNRMVMRLRAGLLFDAAYSFERGLDEYFRRNLAAIESNFGQVQR